MTSNTYHEPKGTRQTMVEYDRLREQTMADNEIANAEARA
jgi:hypothetical protein